ncbi:MAG TPA: hypothetical protein VFP37_14330 [Steroidobacteraceae bacterium]|nr:hypothetical protein [Steroidobacteraceae bacterium]
MKSISSAALAALLSTGVAFAAGTPTAKPASSATPAATATHKHDSAAHCERQAREKKLMGADKDKFVKECKQGKEGKSTG